jgi:hypothetical protein
VLEENKAIVRWYFAQLIAQGNLTVADELFALDYLIHIPKASEYRWEKENKIAFSLEDLKQAISLFHQEPRLSSPRVYSNLLTDMQFTIDDQIAEGDKVATRWTFYAYEDVPEEYSVSGWNEVFDQSYQRLLTDAGIIIDRISGGKIQESWEVGTTELFASFFSRMANLEATTRVQPRGPGGAGPLPGLPTTRGLSPSSEELDHLDEELRDETTEEIEGPHRPWWRRIIGT